MGLKMAWITKLLSAVLTFVSKWSMLIFLMIRFLMKPFSMLLQVDFLSEFYATDLAGKGLFPCVNNFVTLKLGRSSEFLSAVITFEFAIAGAIAIIAFRIFIQWGALSGVN